MGAGASKRRNTVKRKVQALGAFEAAGRTGTRKKENSDADSELQNSSHGPHRSSRSKDEERAKESPRKSNKDDSASYGSRRSLDKDRDSEGSTRTLPAARGSVTVTDTSAAWAELMDGKVPSCDELPNTMNREMSGLDL